MIKIVLRSALIALTLGLAPLSLVAQRAEAPQGWIGISFQVATTTGVRGSTVVTVTEVNRGSPAYDAGLRSGDRLIEAPAHEPGSGKDDTYLEGPCSTTTFASTD